MPKLSIITVNLNNAEGLERTINSVSSQSWEDFEHIIIDGASSDGSVEIIQKYKEVISKWVTEPDKGIYDGMNKGIRMAEGNYCIFLNSGDFFYSNEVLKKVFNRSCTEDIIYGDMMINDGNTIFLGKSPIYISFKKMFFDTLWHPVSFIKKDLFIKYGLYDEKLKVVADYDFFLKVLIVNNVTTKYIPEIISEFNTLGLSSNPENQETIKKERLMVQKKYFPGKLIEFMYELDSLSVNSESFYFHINKAKEILIIRILGKLKSIFS